MLRRAGRGAESRQWLQPLFEQLRSSNRLTKDLGEGVVVELSAILLADKDRGALDWLCGTEFYNLALVHAGLGEFEQAERLLREAIDKETCTSGRSALSGSRKDNALALVLDRLGKTGEAERVRARLPQYIRDETTWKPLRSRSSDS